MDADSPGGTRMVEITFRSPMTREQITRLEASTGMRIRGVHDPARRMVGTGFVGSAASPVMLALTREADGFRVVALSHAPEACDREALAGWRARLLAALDEIGAPWTEEA
jgi:hypothetical protein